MEIRINTTNGIRITTVCQPEHFVELKSMKIYTGEDGHLYLDSHAHRKAIDVLLDQTLGPKQPGQLTIPLASRISLDVKHWIRGPRSQLNCVENRKEEEEARERGNPRYFGIEKHIPRKQGKGSTVPGLPEIAPDAQYRAVVDYTSDDGRRDKLRGEWRDTERKALNDRKEFEEELGIYVELPRVRRQFEIFFSTSGTGFQGFITTAKSIPKRKVYQLTIQEATTGRYVLHTVPLADLADKEDLLFYLLREWIDPISPQELRHLRIPIIFDVATYKHGRTFARNLQRIETPPPEIAQEHIQASEEQIILTKSEIEELVAEARKEGRREALSAARASRQGGDESRATRGANLTITDYTSTKEYIQ